VQILIRVALLYWRSLGSALLVIICEQSSAFQCTEIALPPSFPLLTINLISPLDTTSIYIDIRSVLAVALDMRMLELSCCFLRCTVCYTSGILDGNFPMDSSSQSTIFVIYDIHTAILGILWPCALWYAGLYLTLRVQCTALKRTQHTAIRQGH
jgi:hypothetical protein